MIFMQYIIINQISLNFLLTSLLTALLLLPMLRRNQLISGCVLLVQYALRALLFCIESRK